MIISRTPFRISFFGGGTDYPAWYRKHSGAVLATTIDKYCYITCRYLPPFFDHKYVLAYSKVEYCHNIDEIAHPAIRGVLGYLGCDRGLEIHNDSDLPARSGMGSSSAFTVGLLHALYALHGSMPSKKKLATESIYIEQEILKETVGSQDQALAAYGGLNNVTFLQGGEISVRPVTISKDRINELNAHLMLFYTGIKRTASNIAESYVNGIEERKRQLRIMRDLVDESTSVLASGQDICEFGELLREAWEAKRSLSNKVSNQQVDQLFDLATSAGAIGGKLTGAGGGGFLLLFVPPSKHIRVKEVLHKLIHVPFKFEFSGSQVIFAEHEEDYSAEEKIRSMQTIEGFRELTACSKNLDAEQE
jgi:D-glycero-alpha-D-manno-heptose-7-phosphate kinase